MFVSAFLTVVRATRPTARTAGVTKRLRRLDPDAFVSFCAALWRARGYETRREGDRFVARRAGERLVVLPRPARGPFERRADAVLRWARGVADGESAVDVVVTPVDDSGVSRLADRYDARLVGPTGLVDLLLYGVSRAEADALATEHLGVSTAALLSTDATTTDTGSSRAPTPTAVAAVVGVACLVLAAGLAGVWAPSPTATPDDAAPPLLTGAGTEPRNATDNSSGTPGPTGSNASVERYPPGVGADSVDAQRLARAHAMAVSNRSYRLIIRQSDTDALDGDRRWDGVWQHAVVASDGTWLYTVLGYESLENESSLVQYTRYTDGEFVYRRTDARNGTVYERTPARVDEGVGVHADRTRRYVSRYLATTDVEVDRVSWRPDEHRIVATGRPVSIDGGVSNYTATAFVDETGFVSELTVEFTRTDARDADDESVRFRFEYAAVDDTEVRPPGWYDEARAATGTNATRE